MVILDLNRDSISRSMTREEWKAADRWRRISASQLRNFAEAQREIWDRLAVYGSAYYENRQTDEGIKPFLVEW